MCYKRLPLYINCESPIFLQIIHKIRYRYLITGLILMKSTNGCLASNLNRKCSVYIHNLRHISILNVVR